MEIPLDDERWTWGSAARTPAELHGRACLRFDSGGLSLETAAGIEPVDGAIEVDVAVAAARSFHGVFWRGRGGGDYESFFVRPHQVGNEDSIQYTPVFNGSSGWQLYHGEGFWAPVAFPLGDWFTIRVVAGGETAEIFVGDLSQPVLVARQRHDADAGRVGILVAGEGLHVARFAIDPNARPAGAAPPLRAVGGAIPAWDVSSPFAEGTEPDPESLAWTTLPAEPSGLVDLARLHPVGEELDTVYARATIHSDVPRDAELELGFSDRAVVSLNGRKLYRGDCTYRSRDYRFLGSIGYFDTVVLPLEAGANELVVAVSETFGGWGLQARLP